jgi:hypothetical protein
VRKTTQLQLGDIILLQEDIRLGHLWGRASIEELRKGRDGHVRTVLLRTNDGRQISGSIQLVILLEVDQGVEDIGNS